MCDAVSRMLRVPLIVRDMPVENLASGGKCTALQKFAAFMFRTDDYQDSTPRTFKIFPDAVLHGDDEDAGLETVYVADEGGFV